MRPTRKPTTSSTHSPARIERLESRTLLSTVATGLPLVSAQDFTSAIERAPTPASATAAASVLTVQAEGAARSAGAAIGTQNGGFTGSGYVNLGSSGNYIDIPLSVSASGSATVTIRYANGGSTNRPLSVRVNGSTVSNLTMAPTGSWTTWRDVTTVSFNLTSGTNTIWLASTGAAGANVDSVKITANVTVTPAPASGAWTGTGLDIGNVGRAGSSSTASSTGVVTITGSGADIWASSDAFRFHYQPLTGDGTIVARVTSQQDTDPWAKAGIMFRETLAANSKFAFAAVTPDNGTFYSQRSGTGGSATRSASVSYSGALWLKLARTGNMIASFRSTNGTTWTQTGSYTVSMTANVYVGLAVTSHKAGTLSTVKFDNVSVSTAPVAEPTGWTPLFNGQNLNGFYTYTESQGKNNDTKGYFKVTDGTIHVTDLPTGSRAEFGYLATNATYANYHLRFQFKWGTKKFAPRANVVRDAGVLFHLNGADQLWPQSVEAQIQEGDTGDLWLLGTPGKEPTANVTVANPSAYPRVYKTGGTAYTQRGGRIVKGAEPETLTGWNTVEVIAEGQNAVVMVNGVIVMRMTNLQRPDPNNSSGLVALTGGRIGFQTEGAEVFYRDIEIRQLGQTPAPAGAVKIFDGTSTSNFVKRDGTTGAVGWTVQNGALVVKPGSGDIRTKQSFAGDYKLHVEFKTNVKADSVTEQDRGNSGIGLAGSYELQVLDSYGRALSGTNDLGAVYGIANAATNAALPAGVWQSYDIEFTNARWNGSTKTANARVTVRLNGVLILDDIAIPTSTFTFQTEQPGARPIIFQDHANAVQYRNIWLIPG